MATYVSNDIIPILFTALNPVVDGRCYPVAAAPQNKDYPIIILTITNSEPQSRPTAKQDIRLWKSTVQIDCFADTRDGARDVFNNILVAIENLEDHDEIIQDCILDNYSEEYIEVEGDEQGLFARKIEYSIWHT